MEKKYPAAMKSWKSNWDVICPFFKYSEELRKIMYTTNTIESLNSSYRRINKSRTVFPGDQSLLKSIYLATVKITSNGRCVTKTGFDTGTATDYVRRAYIV